MCNQCHQQLSDEDIAQQMADVLKNPQFEKWNTTSINHVYLAASGVNGPDARRDAFKVLEMLIEWLKTADHVAFLQHGFEPAPPAHKVQKMYDELKAKAVRDGDKPSSELRQEVFEGTYWDELYARCYRDEVSSNFPRQIRMRGLPFMLQGWNNVYTMANDTSDGCPVYRLDEYVLYHLIPIIGVRILRVSGVWHIWRDGDMLPLDIQKNGSIPQGDPFGHWSRNARVEPY